MKENEFKRVLIKGSLGLILVGIVTAAIGFSLSGFKGEKFRSDNKRWYQVITIPKSFDQ